MTVPEGDFADATEFRTVASALVCEQALRCGRNRFWALAESYCHPGFAERAAGAFDSVDLRLARACVAALALAPSCEAAYAAAEICRSVSEGPLGAPCASCPSGHCRDGVCGLPREGEPCELSCEPSLACLGGRCAVPPVVGAACASGDGCGPWLWCRSGRCVAEEPASAAAACCDRTWGGWDRCEVGECVDGRCEPVTAIGCPCAIDATCPFDVSRCVDSVCAARPMLREPCSESGAPCLGAACHDGSCVPGRAGDVCGGDRDCEAALVCGPGCPAGALLCLTGLCGPRLGAGERCGAGLGRCEGALLCSARMLCEPVLEDGAACGVDVLGVCGVDSYCHTEGTCGRYGARRAPCSAAELCAPDLYCSERTSLCLAPSERGEPCSTSLPCRDGLTCLPTRRCGP